MYYKILFLLILCLSDAYAQDVIQSGPMLGYSEMRSVGLWIQTKGSHKVHITIHESGNGQFVASTDTIVTEKLYSYSTKLTANNLEPGKTYNYKVYIDHQLVKFDYPLQLQTLPLWEHRTDPPNFTMAVGSCFYVSEEKYDRPGTPYGGDYQILSHIHQRHPDAMVWLGDNVYFREPDFNTHQDMVYRYTHTRSLPELQPLLANTHHYATWDDHDFGPNDSDGSFIHKDYALDVFNAFWHNTNHGFNNYEDNVVSQFRWGDADFFLLDNRSYRNLYFDKESGKSCFGRKQIDWLILALKQSKANFKMIASGGQFLNQNEVYETYKNYHQEREYFLQRLKEEQIKGVIFLSGDRHHIVIHQLAREGNYTLIDLTVSPLTSKAYEPVKSELSGSMINSTIVSTRNFGLLSFSGDKKNRTLTIEIFDKDNQMKWTQSIKASELK